MSNKTKKKQVQNQAQEGRSMVEMLGVLAVIGVISIGGIAGYRMAMNRYQANQIANEINLMRTDAKMKVARGVELLLGEPYDGDGGHLNFNANYGVAVKFEEIGTDTPGETEKGYSFTLSGIPAGVCKPLATLLDGMDDTAALEINGKDYETAETPCDNEENEVVVAFSTKDIGVSGGIKECDEATCEGYCSADGACKNCPEDAPWNEATKQCKCKTSSKHWNKEIEACAACGDNSHCTGSSKPACIEGVCSACTEESQCDTAQNKHCKISTGQCITCGKYYYEAVWNETAQKCDYCKNVYPDKPKWTGSECISECPEDKPILYSDNQCVECRTNSDCEKEDGQHYWCDTGYYANYGTCNQCAEWDEEKQRCKFGECESNADCDDGEYCYLARGYDCHDGKEFNSNKGFGAGYSDESNTYTSKCRKIEEDINKKGDINSKYIMSTNSMTWQSAKRFCEALPGNKHMVTISELKCNQDQIKYNYDKNAGECREGYCHADGSEQACKDQKDDANDVSEVIKALRKANNGNENSTVHKWLWLKDAEDRDQNNENSCMAYYVILNGGGVYTDFRSRYGMHSALCE